MAHAHTSEAARRCVENGVRSIEHATILDRETAEFLAQSDAFVVPTLIVLRLLVEEGRSLGLSDVMLGKAAEVDGCGRNSLALLREAGARIGFGTDLLGCLMDRQSDEFTLRRDVMSAEEILRSATIVNAELLGEPGRLGELVPGAHADLLILDGDPLTDIAVLGDPARMLLVMKAGEIRRNLKA
jgi:imidazolonepropionase-like amidohydrolase